VRSPGEQAGSRIGAQRITKPASLQEKPLAAAESSGPNHRAGNDGDSSGHWPRQPVRGQGRFHVLARPKRMKALQMGGHRWVPGLSKPEEWLLADVNSIRRTSATFSSADQIYQQLDNINS